MSHSDIFRWLRALQMLLFAFRRDFCVYKLFRLSIMRSSYGFKQAITFVEELEKRESGWIRIADSMQLEKVTFWDYYLPEADRTPMSKVQSLLTEVAKQTRVIVLVGKEPFMRNMLLELKKRGMGQYSNLRADQQYGLVVIPENGAPCGNQYDSYRNPSDGNEDNVKAALEVGDYRFPQMFLTDVKSLILNFASKP